MADFDSMTVQNVMRHIRTQLNDVAEQPQFSSRTILAEMRNCVAYMGTKNIAGLYLYSSAVTLTAGDVLYNVSPLAKAHVDPAADASDLTTSLLDIVFINRNSDGIPMRKISPQQMESVLVSPLPKGKPERWSLHIQQQADATYASRLMHQLLIDRSPQASDLPESLDVMVRTRHSVRFDEHSLLNAILAFDDGAMLGLILWVAGTLLDDAPDDVAAVLKRSKSSAAKWTGRAETLFDDEAARQYRAQLADDFVLVER